VTDYWGAIGILLLGVLSTVLWVASRRSEAVRRRNVNAFGSVVSPAFSRGSAGAMILISGGLILEATGVLIFLEADRRFGAGSTDPRYRFGVRTAFGLMMLLPPALAAFFVVAWSGRPRWFFPSHARDLISPWREAREHRNGPEG
jgi:hypothetical protein